MQFTVNVGDRVELCGSFGSLEGTRGKVIEVSLFEHDGREAFEWVTMYLETPCSSRTRNGLPFLTTLNNSKSFMTETSFSVRSGA